MTKEQFKDWTEQVVIGTPATADHLRRRADEVQAFDPELARLLRAHVDSCDAIVAHINGRRG